MLATLLNNLKVQERQNRVCTTVAIAIVAETCQPFTVLPALMNEYRVPELNVQNGVLKALSFLFEYIGEMGKVCFCIRCSLLVLQTDSSHVSVLCSCLFFALCRTMCMPSLLWKMLWWIVTCVLDQDAVVPAHKLS